MDPDRVNLTRICRNHRRSDGVDAAMDRKVFTKQKDQENRIYYEPRCVEGNYGLPGLLRGARMEDRAFAEGRGADPATKDSATAFVGFPEEDPLLNDR